MSFPRKHHTVPQSLLRRFAAAPDSTQVHTFDKLNGRSFLTSIKDAGSERDFNTVEVNGSTVSFEKLFDDIDGRLAHLVDRLVREQTVACLNAAERRSLAQVVGAQVLRTKMPRTTIRSTAEQLATSFRGAGFDPDEIQNFSIPTDQEIRRATLAMLLNPNDIVSCIEAKHAFLIRSCGPNQPFWTSDNPVALQQTFPYSDLSLNAPGIEIYFPIASNLALAFYCPSIELHIGRALATGDPRIHGVHFSEIYRGIQTGTAVSLGPDTTRFMNALQVLRSSRFVYGPAPDFALAREVIGHIPEACTIEGFVSVGEMGKGHPRRPGMPPGLCVVLFGRCDHHLLRVETWNDTERGFLSLTTRETEALRRVLDDQPLVEAILYKDGDEMRGMRDVRLEVVQGDILKVRVLHQAEGLNQLLRLVDAH